ncbi:hypothetical protein [Candidatus Electronema sp. PJ]|uniref:hypothetical protein n=1 Tax=Candidatus Electronema sp. PJ TaxID=3401572 RepID=UPI003AA9B19D
MKHVLFLIALLVAVGTAQADWEQVGEADFSAGEALDISLALDSSGTPYVAYTDWGDGCMAQASVMRFNGTNWEQVGAPCFSAPWAWYTSLAIDSSGRPYIAYTNGRANVMRFNGTAWEQVGEADFSAGEAWHLSLALDRSGRPYVAYSDRWDGKGKASVMRFNGTTWEQVGKKAFSICEYWYCGISLALDSSDTPYIAYTAKANRGKASVMRFNGTAWEYVGKKALPAWYTTLALDSSDRPYVVYSMYGGKFSVMRFNGTAWKNVGKKGFSIVGGAQESSLVLDSNGTPYFAYMDWGNGGKASVIRFNGTSWEQVGKSLSAVTAWYNSFALDSSGTPYIAYMNEANGGKASVMRFVADNPGPCPSCPYPGEM